MKTSERHNSKISNLTAFLNEYKVEIDEIESEENHTLDATEDQEAMVALIDFTLDFISKSGYEANEIDHSGASEAIYVTLDTPAGSLKVRIATHNSNYDKDFEVVYSSFRNIYPTTEISAFKALVQELMED